MREFFFLKKRRHVSPSGGYNIEIALSYPFPIYYPTAGADWTGEMALEIIVFPYFAAKVVDVTNKGNILSPKIM